MLRETLGLGVTRLSAGSICFVFRRVRPGVVAVLGAGADRGDLGEAPVEELERELARFPLPTDVFVDASRVELVGLPAQDVWTGWLRRGRPRLRRMHVLVGSRHVGLSISVARHHSGLMGALRPYRRREDFEAALAAAAGEGEVRVDPSHLDARPIRLARSEGLGVVRLEDGQCTAVLRRLVPRKLLVRIEGADRGALADAVFDELAAARREGPLSLFFDLRDADVPSLAVSDLWTAWLSANQPALESVVLLADRGPLHVTVSIASFRSHTGSLVQVMRDPHRFERAVSVATALPL